MTGADGKSALVSRYFQVTEKKDKREFKQLDGVIKSKTASNEVRHDRMDAVGMLSVRGHLRSGLVIALFD